MHIIVKGGERVKLIGDPHLGKAFHSGVPLHRRGEREKSQFERFKKELAQPADFVVIVGDLFDHPYVSYAVVAETANALLNAAAMNRDTQYIVMAGNHDMPRNIEAVGAFDNLKMIAHLRIDNLNVIDHPMQVGPIAMFPWQWHLRADEQRILSPVTGRKVELVVGHWDLKQFGENDRHMAPVKMLRQEYGDVPLYSGHYHVPGTYKVNGVDVICTGSMEPYSHGEDPNGDLYVTLTLDELGEHDPVDFKDRCVRILLREGEELPTDLDCLSLTPKRVTDNDAEDDLLVERGNFVWSDILKKKLADVPKPVKSFINERLQNEG